MPFILLVSRRYFLEYWQYMTHTGTILAITEKTTRIQHGVLTFTYSAYFTLHHLSLSTIVIAHLLPLTPRLNERFLINLLPEKQNVLSREPRRDLVAKCSSIEQEAKSNVHWRRENKLYHYPNCIDIQRGGLYAHIKDEMDE